MARAVSRAVRRRAQGRCALAAADSRTAGERRLGLAPRPRAGRRKSAGGLGRDLRALSRDERRGFGIDADNLELRYEPFNDASLYRRQGADAAAFLGFVNRWMELTGVLNELARSMGRLDFYPFVLSSDAVRKLHFVHLVILGTSGLSTPSVSPIGGGITGGSRTGTGLSAGDGGS